MIKRAVAGCAFVLSLTAGVIACGSSTTGNPNEGAGNGTTDASMTTANPGVGTGTGSGDDGGTSSGSASCAPNGDAVRTAPFTFVGPNAGQCTAAQIDALVAACYPGTDQDCNAFFNDAANDTCNGCVFGTGAQDVLPPIYNWTEPDGGIGALTYVNVGGCIALNAPSESACAQSEALASACESDQCNGCPLDNNASEATYDSEFDALSGCFDQAAKAGCATMESTVQMCQARLDPSVTDGGVSSCFHLVDSSGLFTPAVWTYVKLACAGASGVTDGGSANLDGGDAGDAGAH